MAETTPDIAGTGASKPAIVEQLSRRFHAIYQAEARRQAGVGDDTVRHPDEYDALPEHTKEYDRVLARDVLQFLDLLAAGLSNKTAMASMTIAEIVAIWAAAPVEP